MLSLRADLGVMKIYFGLPNGWFGMTAWFQFDTSMSNFQYKFGCF
jgi:hypothetical protein